MRARQPIKIVHLNNFCWVGGVGTFCKDLALAMPEFSHEVVYLSRNQESAAYINWFRNHGIPCYYCPMVTAEFIDTYEPDVLCLHNSNEKRMRGPFEYLKRPVVINFHHARTPLFPHTDLDVFVSDYMRNIYWGWEGCMSEHRVIYPGTFAAPYLAVKPRADGPVRIGRISSGTNNHVGKWRGFAEDMLAVENATFLYVGCPETDRIADDRIEYREVVAGGTADFLSEIDIFAIDCPTLETWSRVASEAMLAGKPVVAVNHGDGLAEQMTKARGPLVPNRKELVRVLGAFVKSRELRETVGADLRAWALENVTEKQLREALFDFIAGRVL